MTEFKVGDRVFLWGSSWLEDFSKDFRNELRTVEGFAECDVEEGVGVVPYFSYQGFKTFIYQNEHSDYSARLVYRPVSESPEGLVDFVFDCHIGSRSGNDAVNPSHYVFPGGVEVHQISGYLTSFAGQALQYIARSCRIDGNNKSDNVREDIEKAIKFLNLELERINR